MNILIASNLIKKWSPKTKIQSGFFYTGMPDDAYHNFKAHSRSDVFTLIKEPLKFKRGIKLKQTRNMEVGTALHCLVLEPKRFDKEFVLALDIESKKSSEYKKLKKEYSEDKIFINSPSNPEAANLLGMKAALYENPTTRNILKFKGFAELSGFWTDEKGHMWKVRFDYVTENGVALDLKKSKNVDVTYLERSINSYGYYFQNAFYDYIYEKITGVPLTDFIFGFVQEDAPHLVVPVELAFDFLTLGRNLINIGFTEFAKYMENRSDIKNDTPLTLICKPKWIK